MRTGRPNAELMLTAEERHTLEQWTRRPRIVEGADRERLARDARDWVRVRSARRVAKRERPNLPVTLEEFGQQFVQVGGGAARFRVKDARGDEEFHKQKD